MSSKSRAKLLWQLDQIFPMLFEDLRVIASSESLETWRALKKYEFRADFKEISKAFDNLSSTQFKRTYIDKIREIKGKDGKKLYWLEEFSPHSVLDRIRTKKRPYYSDRIFEPKHMFTGTSIRNNPGKIKIIVEAVDCNCVPKKKEEAIDFETMLSKLKKRKESMNEEIERCPKCGYRYSYHCSECRTRFNEITRKKFENIHLHDHTMFLEIDSGEDSPDMKKIIAEGAVRKDFELKNTLYRYYLEYHKDYLTEASKRFNEMFDSTLKKAGINLTVRDLNTF